MALELEKLLAPVSEEEPAGPDLAYDPERFEIEQAFESSVSVDTNGEETAASEIDWRRIINLIEAQSARTKDVWLPVYLCRAGARSGRFDVVEAGAKYLGGLVEQYWETVHPQLEEYGFQGRKGPCDSLARITEFLGPLQKVTLLEHPRLGRYSAFDFERFRAGAEGQDGYGVFRAALQETPEENLVAIAARLDAITEGFRQADKVLTANAEGDTATNFQPAYDVLNQMKRAVLAFTTAPTVEEEAGAEEGAAPEGDESGGGPRIAGRVDSREDVIRALDAIGDYYRRREPGSPVPLVLKRAKEWVTLDFLTMLEEIAPSSMEEARRLLVSKRSPDE